MVLGLEQAKLQAQAPRAQIIVSRAGELIDYDSYLASMGADLPEAGPMLNLYPDSLGGTMAEVVDFLTDPAVEGAFPARPMCCRACSTPTSTAASRSSTTASTTGTRRPMTSPRSPTPASASSSTSSSTTPRCCPLQFQDLLAKGERSAYARFFVDWNEFWAGHGEMTQEGYIQPDPALIADMFFRKPGLPILMVRLPDGTEKPYWNTFYQEVRYAVPDAAQLMSAAGLQYASAAVLAGRSLPRSGAAGRRGGRLHRLRGRPAGRRRVAGVAALLPRADGPRHPLAAGLAVLRRHPRHAGGVWRPDRPARRLRPCAEGAGRPELPQRPGTWDLLDRVKALASRRGMLLLPEIHSTYESGIHQTLSEKGFVTYDFFLPGLLIGTPSPDATPPSWRAGSAELVDRQIRTVSMLGCHDGIPLLDLLGLLTHEQIESVIDLVTSRGGHSRICTARSRSTTRSMRRTTPRSAESDDALLLARAIQLFVPGKPQVWYLDLFAGRNDHDAVAAAGPGGHKEINRTNLSVADVESGLDRPVVRRQLELLRFRRSFPAFGYDAQCSLDGTHDDRLVITWTRTATPHASRRTSPT